MVQVAERHHILQRYLYERKDALRDAQPVDRSNEPVPKEWRSWCRRRQVALPRSMHLQFPVLVNMDGSLQAAGREGLHPLTGNTG